MKKKDLKKLAQQIAAAEQVINNSNSSKEEIEKSKNIILNLTSKVTSLSDMMLLDDMI